MKAGVNVFRCWQSQNWSVLYVSERSNALHLRANLFQVLKLSLEAVALGGKCIRASERSPGEASDPMPWVPCRQCKHRWQLEGGWQC